MTTEILYAFPKESEGYSMDDDKDARGYSDELLRIVEEFRQRIVEGTSDPIIS
jgi:hypothetical protein